jgi:hypothetical protein
MPRLPEGAQGIAAKFPGDQGIDQDSCVVFADGFENDKGAWDNAWGAVAYTESAENVHGGRKALELRMTTPARGKETSLGVQKHYKKGGFDVLFLRYYAKFDKDMDMFHHNHRNVSIKARADGIPDAKPGVPSNGRNEYTVCLETSREKQETAPPGELNIYCYHPNQRSRWGDHFYPNGLITPQPAATSPKALFGSDFEPRPNVIPPRNVWACYELMVKANTPGRRDGRIGFWVNGVIAGDFPNLRLRDTASLKSNVIGINMSTLYDHPGKPNTMWFDDVVIATSYIGPMHAKSRAK